MKTGRSSRARAGFSLVEVVLALGILAFCLVAILGLTSMGLKITQQNSTELSAAQLLTGINASLRSAVTTDGTNYSAALPFSTLSWKVGGPRVNLNFWVTESGTVSMTAPSSPNSLAVFVSLLPPASADACVFANATVAWPGIAVKVTGWNGAAGQAATPTLSSAAGWIGTPFCLLPRP